MAYSKITSIEITNFMVYRHAKIMFDDCNIINLKGYNSAGKSTILKAIGVCLTNMFSTQQAKLIKHGEDFFRIVVSFDDGISILRDKYANGQSLYEMYKSGELLLTTKKGRKLDKVSEVPKDIQDYLGLCMTQIGCLNYQSRQDRLWLIETKGSENYYSLNEILRTEEIARASQLINTDKNKLGSEIANIEATLNEVSGELERISGVDDRLLLALEEKENYCNSLISKYKGTKALLSIAESLLDLQEIPKVSSIDSNRMEAITKLVSDAETLFSLKDIPEVSLLGVERLDSVSRLVEMAKSVDSQEVISYPEVEIIDVDTVNPLGGMIDTLGQLNKYLELQRGIEADLKSAKVSMEKAVELAKRDGKKFVQCDSCGSYMEVSIA